MSTFIVSSEHIDALLTYAKNNNINFDPHFQNLTDVGQCLVDENYRSDNYRYSERKKPYKYNFKPYPQHITHIQAFKALECLDYQCCELKKNSPKYKHIYGRLKDHLTHKIIYNLPEYTGAAWAIE